MLIGFFPITGDPIHYGHLNGAMKVLHTFNLDTVFIQLCGDLTNHKPYKVSKYHRHQMAKLAIQEFHPYLQYTPMGYDNTLVGESIFIEFIKNPAFCEVQKFYYIAGGDNEQIVLSRFIENHHHIIKPYEIIFLTRANFKIKSYSKTVVYSENISSSLFRMHQNKEIVPKSVLEYCINHHLYGY